MYRDQILDLYKNPQNEGSIEEPDMIKEGSNPSCGDETTVHIELHDGNIRKVMHQTNGCAISTAAISIVSEEIKGMSPEEVLDLDKDWILSKMDIEVSPMRLKCVLLGLNTIQEAIKEDLV